MDRLVWAIIDMVMFRHIPMTQLVNQLDIPRPSERPFVTPRAFLQARQKLGDKRIERLFHYTAARGHRQVNHPGWAGLRLLAVDGVMWRTPDTPTMPLRLLNPTRNKEETPYPQLRMLCQMALAGRLIERTPDHSLTLFDMGFYSLGLLHAWQIAGSEGNWLLPLKKAYSTRLSAN